MATTEERRYALLHRCLRPTGGCAQISELLLRWTDIYSFRGEVTLPVERVTFYGGYDVRGGNHIRGVASISVEG